MILSVTAGVHIGSWTNFQLGIMREAATSPPYAILWPSFEMMGTFSKFNCNNRDFCDWCLLLIIFFPFSVQV